MKDQIESTDAERREPRRRGSPLPPDDGNDDRIEGEEDDLDGEEDEEEEDDDEDDDTGDEGEEGEEGEEGDDEEEEDEEGVEFDDNSEETILAKLKNFTLGVDDLPPVMNVGEVALLLRVTPKTVYNMARRGTLPGVKVGRSVRFDRKTVLDWLRGLLPPHRQRGRLS